MALPPSVVSPSVVKPVVARALTVTSAVAVLSLALSMLPVTPGLFDTTAEAVDKLLPLKVTKKIVS